MITSAPSLINQRGENRMKRVVCIVLALLLSIGLCLTATASENPDNDYYIGESNGYEIWMLNPTPPQPMETVEVIGDYLFLNGSLLGGFETPTSIYAVKGDQEVYIKDAYEQGLIDISKVARMVNGFCYDEYPESAFAVCLFGDLNDTWSLEVADVVLIQKIIVKSYNASNRILCDVNHDDEINLEDVILLQKKIAKIEA